MAKKLKEKKPSKQNNKKNNKLYLNAEALADIMTVLDMKKFTGWGINNCYGKCKSGEFPVNRTGKSYLIPKDSFLRWFYGEKIEHTPPSLPELEQEWKKLFDNLSRAIILQPQLT